MRIDEITVQNFKKFEQFSLTLHPHFTLLAGDNGSGKTSILDALAVAAGIWLAEVPDSDLVNSRRNILPNEIRLEAASIGDRTQFRQCLPVKVTAKGEIGGQGLAWTRQIRSTGGRTSNVEAKEALEAVRSIFKLDASGAEQLVPIVAYYGAGRAWLPSNKRTAAGKSNGPAKRWAAFYDCFNERIRFEHLHRWFERENLQRFNRNGQWRSGFEIVRQAIVGCLPDCDGLWFDTDYAQIVLSIGGAPQPFDNLSAGQRMMLSLVADLAIKCVTQNAFLVPAETDSSQHLPRVLRETPGVVLIDELDVHLHPKWQRRVAKDLKSTFPNLQFVCTSHSPQVIGELEPNEIRVLDGDAAAAPSHSFGIDSSRILEEIMSAPSRNELTNDLMHRFAVAVDRDRFEDARLLLWELEQRLGEGDPDVTRSRTLLKFVETAGV